MRLIDADALKENLFIKFGNQLPNGLLDEIDNAPTVEPTFREVVAYECGQKSVERQQSKWMYDNTINNWRCSECGETPKTIGYVGTAKFMYDEFKFCNHCGASMRGDT